MFIEQTMDAQLWVDQLRHEWRDRTTGLQKYERDRGSDSPQDSSNASGSCIDAMD